MKTTGSFKTVLENRTVEPIQLVNNITRPDKRREWKNFWATGNRPKVQGNRGVKRMFWRGAWERFRDV